MQSSVPLNAARITMCASAEVLLLTRRRQRMRCRCTSSRILARHAASRCPTPHRHFVLARAELRRPARAARAASANSSARRCSWRAPAASAIARGCAARARGPPSSLPPPPPPPLPPRSASLRRGAPCAASLTQPLCRARSRAPLDARRHLDQLRAAGADRRVSVAGRAGARCASLARGAAAGHWTGAATAARREMTRLSRGQISAAIERRARLVATRDD